MWLFSDILHIWYYEYCGPTYLSVIISACEWILACKFVFIRPIHCLNALIHLKKVITKNVKNVFRERYPTFQKNVLGTKRKLPAENIPRTVNGNILRRFLEPNISSWVIYCAACARIQVGSPWLAGYVYTTSVCERSHIIDESSTHRVQSRAEPVRDITGILGHENYTCREKK